MGEELQLSLLGNLQVRLAGTPVTGFRSSKVQALLCYLAVTGRPHLRPVLAGLLWGELSETSARSNLSKALTNLRQVASQHLSTTRHEVAFNRESPYWLDVEAFEEGVSPGVDIDRLQDAVDLYRGDFLEGFYVHQALAFEEWVLAQRTRLRELALQALHTLAAFHTQRGAAGHAAGIDYTTRLLALEPWREEAHRQLMTLLARSGQRSAALAQYETCRQVLEEELGVVPGTETTALYERIRDEKLEAETGEQKIRVDRDGVPVAPPPFLSTLPPFPPVSTPFVARERELNRLDEYLADTLVGHGRVVFVTGEAGTGKTALVQEFARRAQAEHGDLVVATGNCNAFTGVGDPYLPFRKILGQLTGDVGPTWAAGALDTEGASRLWALIPHAGRALVETSPDLIGAFLVGRTLVDRARAAAPGGGHWLDRLEERLADVEPSRAHLQQTDLFEQYVLLLTALARQYPLLLAVDDLQWADAGSISLLFHLGRSLTGSRILTVGSYRPTEVALGREGPSTGSGKRERHPLQSVVHEFQRQFGQFEVALGQTGDQRFVEAFLDSEPNRLDAAFRKALYDRTQGHALYTVEMVRGMRERGALVQDESGHWVEGKAVDWASLPARVEGTIGERIARLPTALRETLKVASVEGETFTAEIVAQVQGVAEREIIRQLSGELDKWHRLVVSVGSQRSAPSGQRTSRYRFRHILFQEYVYKGLDEVERACLHEAVGDALEQQFEDHTEDIAIQLARHYRVAGLELKAIDYLHQAGERALRSYAFQEAIHICDQALALIEVMPDTPERAQRELVLQLARGNALIVTKGYGDPQARSAYTRAQEMCQKVGETPQLFQALFGLWVHYFTRAEYQPARELGERLLNLAQDVGDQGLLLQAHHTLWTSLFPVGDYASAHSHVERGLALYVPEIHSSYVFPYAGHDAKVCGLSWGGPTLWCLGYPDQALRRNREALALAQDLSHPVSLTIALKWLAALYQLRREDGAVQEWAEATITLASEQRLPLWLGWAGSLRGWALARQGRGEAGIAQIRQGMATYQATGAALDQPYMLALLAEAYGSVGQTEEGLRTVDEALMTAHMTGECYYEAELHRLKGEFLLAQNASAAVAKAEVCFHQAIEVAVRQGARSLELRAAVSLSRLWQRQGKRKEAHRMLTEIHDWFTEGFDTVDLRQAGELLEELAR